VNLAAEGESPIDTWTVTLAKADGEAPHPIAMAPIVTLQSKFLEYQGRMIGAVPITDHGKALHDAFAAGPQPAEVLLVVDASVPWSSVAAAATATGATHVTFVLAAGAPGKTSPPPPSSIDKELDEMAKPPDSTQKAPKLIDPRDPNFHSIPDRIFKDCSTIKGLFDAIGKADTASGKDELIVKGFPKAIAACNCKVEIPAVQRLLWSWFRRDSSPAVAGIKVELAANGTPVTAKPTAPWSEASNSVIAAAKAGKPLSLR
jgi:hypothetical protein